jgi:hypothetical protein
LTSQKATVLLKLKRTHIQNFVGLLTDISNGIKRAPRITSIRFTFNQVDSWPESIPFDSVVLNGRDSSLVRTYMPAQTKNKATIGASISTSVARLEVRLKCLVTQEMTGNYHFEDLRFDFV